MSVAGYRWWYAGRRPGPGWRLRSLSQPWPRAVWWEGPHLRAPVPPRLRCPCGCFETHDCHRSGIHAFRTEERAWGDPPPPSRWHDVWGDYIVFGEVAMWGKVVEHEHGYRAEHAIVRRLVVPARLVIHSPAPSLPCTLLIGDEESFGPVTTEEIPEHGMAETLVRRYGVDVDVGPPMRCQVRR